MTITNFLRKFTLVLGFAMTLVTARWASADTLVNVSMSPAPSNDPGFNVFSNPTVVLQKMDPATQITFTFTNKTPLTVGEDAYGKIAANGFLVGYVYAYPTKTAQQFQVTTTISALLASLNCNGNTSCQGLFTIGWGDDESPDFFTDSMLINLQYQ